MAHIGNIGERVTVRVTLKGDYTFYTHYSYHGEMVHIYSMEDNNGNAIVWKTATCMGAYDSNDEWSPVNRGDTIEIVGTVKQHGEYNGHPQTVLTRAKVKELVSRGKTPYEVAQDKARQQLATLGESDRIEEILYRDYKHKFANYEKLYNSYDADKRTIKVIIRG